jgi:hypothetical protein
MTIHCDRKVLEDAQRAWEQAWNEVLAQRILNSLIYVPRIVVRVSLIESRY